MEYKNISKKDLILIGYGLVKAGETIKTKDTINNANFQEVSKKIEDNSKKEEEIINNKTKI